MSCDWWRCLQYAQRHRRKTVSIHVKSGIGGKYSRFNMTNTSTICRGKSALKSWQCERGLRQKRHYPQAPFCIDNIARFRLNAFLHARKLPSIHGFIIIINIIIIIIIIIIILIIIIIIITTCMKPLGNYHIQSKKYSVGLVGNGGPKSSCSLVLSPVWRPWTPPLISA